MTTGQREARRALAVYAALQDANGAEPALDSAGMPEDPEAWTAWFHGQYKPAYRKWAAAMDALDAALGESVSRHPFNFIPLCERISGGAQ